MATPRPLLIPWLIEQINSGKYPGLNWTNVERTEFCVPWKHGLRQDSSSYDVLIFKAWAEVSGAYVEGESPSDSSVWKRNFRSALRAKGFLMITDNKNDAANPHKVFRFPDGRRLASSGRAGKRTKRETKRDANTGGAGSTESQDVFSEPDVYEDLNSHQLYPYDVYVPGDVPIPTDLEAAQYNDHPGPDKLDEILRELNICGPQPEMVQPTVHLGQVDYPTEAVAGVDSEQQRLTQFSMVMSKTVVDNTLSTSFKVSVYYRGLKVLEQLVENNAGFRVVFSPEQVHHHQGLATVFLPSPDQIPVYDSKQAQLTQQILEKLGEGLEVMVQGPAIHAIRRGGSRVYWSLCKHERRDEPQEVSKQGNLLYTLKEFISGLLKFMTNGGHSPSFSLFFCLGEKWPDPSQRPWEKKLIMLEVVVTSLELMKMIAVEGGASSLQSVELQLSGSVNFMKSLEELMDIY